MRGRRIPIALPNTGALARRRYTLYLRRALIVILVLFVFFQLHVINYDWNDTPTTTDSANDTTAAILQMVPPVLHKYLTVKTRSSIQTSNYTHNFNISDIQQLIARYNDMQLVLNEDIFGPLQNDSVIVVVQVHKRISYLRHLIVSLAQARDISKTLLVFSHDFYDDDINELVQSIDFCKVMQIFYPYSIQTHPNEYPGADPNDCPRNMKMEQALIRNCNNAKYPDLYGHYREAAFTQTKHHWWWKANRVFKQLEINRYHTGLVLFLEEDHYVTEDFLYILDLLNTKGRSLCSKCNILSLGTYLKTFNYYTYNKKNNNKALYGYYSHSSSSSSSSSSTSFASSSLSSSSIGQQYNKYHDYNININNYNNIDNNNYNFIIKNERNANAHKLPIYMNMNAGDDNKKNKDGTNVDNNGVIEQTFTTEKYSSQSQWGYQVLPSIYSIYQKVEVTPWISSKHNMGMAFNRTTWDEITKCSEHFCNYDDYNWDWSLQHVSQQCLQNKLYAMVVKGPRVFHIGECGVHHKKSNCESNLVISKVQQVIRMVAKNGQLFPKGLTLTVASIVRRTKLRKGNGGWGDKRDHLMCLNMTLANR